MKLGTILKNFSSDTCVFKINHRTEKVQYAIMRNKMAKCKCPTILFQTAFLKKLVFRGWDSHYAYAVIQMTYSYQLEGTFVPRTLESTLLLNGKFHQLCECLEQRSENTAVNVSLVCSIQRNKRIQLRMHREHYSIVILCIPESKKISTKCQ